MTIAGNADHGVEQVDLASGRVRRQLCRTKAEQARCGHAWGLVPSPDGRTAWIVRSGVNGSELASEFTELDLALQDHFYNFETRRWVVDEKAPLGRLVFYNGPKALVWIFALTTLALAAGPAAAAHRLALAAMTSHTAQNLRASSLSESPSP